ncbi:nose resistant to fluoxetine protein 6-like isoform X2 [Tubulanus polymorphus]|uniref:nose resistant to fluoxetine protein 6-like isoform X2 n=1 Tax=Tubulanus polymorphus TaxID=672921 RepID=UPI003DA1EF0A
MSDRMKVARRRLCGKHCLVNLKMEVSFKVYFVLICLVSGTCADDDAIPHLIERGSVEPGLPSALRRAVDEMNNGTAKVNSSITCLSDMETMLGAWTQQKPWSLSMFDATGKPNSDHLVSFGKYDQCRSVIINDTGVSFHAQYCYSTFELHTNKIDIPIYLNYGTCFPSTCRPYDTQVLVNTVIGNFGVNTTTKPAKTACKIKDKPPFGLGHWIVICIFGTLGIFIAVVTVYDLMLRKRRGDSTREPSDGVEIQLDTLETENAVVVDETVNDVSNEKNTGTSATVETKPNLSIVCKDVILAFSAYDNLLKLVSLESSGDTINCIHGIRFITMFWIILGHTYDFFFIFVRSENVIEYASSLIKNWSFSIVYAGYYSVETFFFLSGLVLTYISMKKMLDSGGPKNINWFMFYFHRFWRLTPLYLALWMIYVTFSSYFGDGPLYPDYSSLEGSGHWCSYSSFLFHIAYINNFIPSGCMGWAWFLAVDMQLHVISPICLLAFYWHYGAGIGVVILFCLANYVSVGVSSTLIGLTPPSLTDYRYIFFIYYKPWSHFSPFVIGVMVGYLLCSTRDKKWNIHWALVTIGWLIAAALVLIPVFTAFLPSTQLENSIYLSLAATAWCLGLSWIVFACHVGYGGPVNWLLSLKIFAPLSRLTYSAYLIHPIVILAVYKSLQPPLFGNNITLVYISNEM